jgi:hypothetical protein
VVDARTEEAYLKGIHHLSHIPRPIEAAAAGFHVKLPQSEFLTKAFQLVCKIDLQLGMNLTPIMRWRSIYKILHRVDILPDKRKLSIHAF